MIGGVFIPFYLVIWIQNGEGRNACLDMISSSKMGPW